MMETIRELIEVYESRKLQTKIDYLVNNEVKVQDIQALNQLAHLILNQITVALANQGQSAKLRA